MKASTAGQISSVVVRLAIICAACDIPALCKLSGFAGHSAAMVVQNADIGLKFQIGD